MIASPCHSRRSNPDHVLELRHRHPRHAHDVEEHVEAAPEAEREAPAGEPVHRRAERRGDEQVARVVVRRRGRDRRASMLTAPAAPLERARVLGVEPLRDEDRPEPDLLGPLRPRSRGPAASPSARPTRRTPARSAAPPVPRTLPTRFRGDSTRTRVPTRTGTRAAGGRNRGVEGIADRRADPSGWAPWRSASGEIVVLAYDGIQSLDVTGPVEVFDVATRHGIDAAVPGRGRRPDRRADRHDERDHDHARPGARPTSAAPVDTFVVAGGDGVDDQRSTTRARRRRSAGSPARSRRVASVCTGAFLLAEAGLLDGRRVTTHWASLPAPRARGTRTSTVDPDPIFVRDGDVYTSAGVTAGIDLCLALVEEDHGRELALVGRPPARRVPQAARAGRRSSAATSRPSSPSATCSPRCRAGSPTTSTTTCRVAAPRRARRDEPPPLRPGVPGRDRRDAGPLRRAGPGRAGPPPARGVERRASRRSPTAAASAPPRRCGARSSGRCWVGPSEYRQRFRAADPELDRGGLSMSDHDRDPAVRRRRGARLRRAVRGVRRWPRMDGDRVVTIAERLDPVRCAKGLRVLPDHTFADAPDARRARRPGRPGHAPRGRQPGAARLDRARSRPAAPGSRASAPGRSSCTRPAPARASRSRPTGPRSTGCATQADVTVHEQVRYVRDGNVVTAAGVSAGHRHGPLGRRPDLRRRARPGHPVRHGVRPRAALRRAVGLSARVRTRPAPAALRARPQAAGRGAPMVRIVDGGVRGPMDQLPVEISQRIRHEARVAGLREAARALDRDGRAAPDAALVPHRRHRRRARPRHPRRLVDAPARSTASPASSWILRGAVAALGLGFCVYAVEKEIHLHRLSRLLVDERVLNSAMAKRLQMNAALFNAGKALNSVLDLDEVLDAILANALDLLGGATGSVMLVEDEESAPRRRGARQPPRPRRPGEARRVDRRPRRAQPRAAPDQRRQSTPDDYPGYADREQHDVERDVRAAREPRPAARRAEHQRVGRPRVRRARPAGAQPVRRAGRGRDRQGRACTRPSARTSRSCSTPTA